MARKKKLPSVTINYDTLTDELKGVYNQIYLSLAQKNIYKLREEAQAMSIESPTTLSKVDLLKRMSDRLIDDYMPHDNKNDESDSTGLGVNGNIVKGIYFGGFVDDIAVSKNLAERSMIRDGDLIKGIYAKTAKDGYVMTYINENEQGKEERPCFDQLKVVTGAEFDGLCDQAKMMFPKLRKGERVLVSSLAPESAKVITGWFDNVLFLPIGVLPESPFANEQFAVPFDASAKVATRTALIVAERAKRLCEEGKDVVIVACGLNTLDSRDGERAVFGAGRCLDIGSITVIADADKNKDCGAYVKAATRVL